MYTVILQDSIWLFYIPESVSEQCSNLTSQIVWLISIGVRDSRTFTDSHFDWIREDALSI